MCNNLLMFCLLLFSSLFFFALISLPSLPLLFFFFTQAQLRAHVFSAIEEQENVNAHKPADTTSAKKLAGIAATPQASLILDLIKEWLEFYELDYTNSTLLAEAKLPQGSVGSSSKDRTALLAALQLQSHSNDRPLLVELLMHTQSMQQTLASPTSRTSATASPLPPVEQDVTIQTLPPRIGVPQLPRGTPTLINKNIE